MKKILSSLFITTWLLSPSYAETPKTELPPAPPVSTQDANADSKKEPDFTDPKLYLEYKEASDGAAVLKTSTLSFKNDQDVEVDLIGVVHVGEKEYYEKFNVLFKTYDSLLFEMIGGTSGLTVDELRNKSGRFNVVRAFQVGITKALNLQFQLDHIDYSAPNFVHADMSSEGFKQAQEKRGESFWKMLFLNQNQQSDLGENPFAAPKGGIKDPSILDLINLAAQGKAADPLKRIMGRTLGKLDEASNSMFGGNESAIITDRNKVAFDVLDEQIQDGKKRLGVFYGAAHLPDMVQRLIERGFKFQSTQWHTAWVVPPAPKQEPSDAPTEP